MRENEVMVNYFHGLKLVDLSGDVRMVGGAGIFQIFEPKLRPPPRRVLKLDVKTIAWRVASIWNAQL